MYLRNKKVWNDGLKEIEKALENNEKIKGEQETREKDSYEEFGKHVLDLTIREPEDGLYWDFNNSAKADKTRILVSHREALLVAGSPMCVIEVLRSNKDISTFNQKATEELIENNMGAIDFHAEVYERQQRNQFCCVHEHPTRTFSGSRDNMRSLEEKDGTYTLAFGKHGLHGECRQNRKNNCEHWRNEILTTSDHIAEECRKPWQDAAGRVSMCEAIQKGLNNHLRADGRITGGGVGMFGATDREEGEALEYWGGLPGNKLNPQRYTGS